ncbi:protein CFAP276 [Anastrepha ludens]|uniref:protein CFAP276 n=1 Tax=Anastrepha ludens TaxID=28586 RepID=UPI0023B05F4A|nr:protein CFAP276 [Anastrepha ludens]
MSRNINIMPKMKIRIRNAWYEPDLSSEGIYLCPMPQPPPSPAGALWSTNLKPHERLFYHQTLNSVRQSKRFIATPQIPRDSLDFRLQARYDHSHEIFPEPVDTVLQRETCAYQRIDGDSQDNIVELKSFRVLQNVKTVQLPASDAQDHPLKIGGIKEKISPHSVKLINSGVHSQLVNNGFSRQTGDGNFFRY